MAGQKLECGDGGHHVANRGLALPPISNIAPGQGCVSWEKFIAGQTGQQGRHIFLWNRKGDAVSPGTMAPTEHWRP